MNLWSWKFLVLGSSILSGCSHLSATKNLLTPDFLLTKGSQQVTFLGDNERPRFSEDGSRLIYTSHNRGHQKNLQLFELDLTRNKERRVTYSDGDAFDPMFASDSEIVYASTTDEIKESPFLNKNPDKEFPPSDLYMSDGFGADIVRLTQQPGYDAEPIFVKHPTESHIIFTSRRGNLTGIYRVNLTHGLVSLVSAEAGKDRRSPTLSPDQKELAFIEKDLKSGDLSMQLLNMKTKQAVTLKAGEGLYRDLFFAPKSPRRVFYSILRKGEKKYQLEVYNLETKCTQVVFKGTDSLLYPTVSNESRERLAFARLFQDRSQIYIVNLPPDLGPCLEQQNAVAAPVTAPTVAPAAPVPGSN
ncbi:MAG: TolB family protein [Bacillota bacterium]